MTDVVVVVSIIDVVVVSSLIDIVSGQLMMTLRGALIRIINHRLLNSGHRPSQR